MRFVAGRPADGWWRCVVTGPGMQYHFPPFFTHEATMQPRQDQKHQWQVAVFGKAGESSWEISVVRDDNKHGQKSYGWFDDRKLLVGSDGGPCRHSVCGFVWSALIATANELCRRLNAGEDVQCNT